MMGTSRTSRIATGRGRRGRKWAAALVFGAGAALVAAPASALNWDLGPESNLNLVTSLEYTIGYRAEDPSEEILANPNADDGNRAFRSGLFQNEISALTELSFTYENFGLFLRAEAFFNLPYNNNSQNHHPSTDNTPSNPPYEFVVETEQRHRSDIRLLDAFVYGNFNIGETFLTLTVGRQVISWGESLFLGGISAVQNPIDVTESHEPAVEIKTLFLPQGAVQAQWKLTSNLSMAAYYRWQWEPIRLDATGSYFSSADMLAGGEVFYIPGAGGASLPKGGEILPDDGGQYGVNIHYIVPALGYTDFGLYYLHYNAKAPQFIIKGGKYYTKYFGDIDLYGASVSRTLFRYFTLGVEASYRTGRPVAAVDSSSGTSVGPVRADIVNVLVNSIYHSPISLLWSGTTTLSVGVGYNELLDFKEDGVEVSPTKDEAGATYTASLALAYPNIAPLLSMTITPSISKAFHNDSAVRAGYNSGNTQLGLDVSFQYLAKWDFGVSYVMFRGEPEENGLTDRDFVSANVKYTF